MSDERKAFVDTNILVYAHDQGSGIKHGIAKTLIDHLWQSGTGVLSTQVLQELCVSLERKAGLPPDARELGELVEDYRAWEIHINTVDSILQALQIRQRFKVSFWDAMVLQAAVHSGASVLYSEDFSHGQHYGSVVVVNPFKS